MLPMRYLPLSDCIITHSAGIRNGLCDFRPEKSVRTKTADRSGQRQPRKTPTPSARTVPFSSFPMPQGRRTPPQSSPRQASRTQFAGTREPLCEAGYAAWHAPPSGGTAGNHRNQSGAQVLGRLRGQAARRSGFRRSPPLPSFYAQIQTKDTCVRRCPLHGGHTHSREGNFWYCSAA